MPVPVADRFVGPPPAVDCELGGRLLVLVPATPPGAVTEVKQQYRSEACLEANN